MVELGTDSFLERPERKVFHVGFVGQGKEMGIYFLGVHSRLPILHVRELPEFASLCVHGSQ